MENNPIKLVGFLTDNKGVQVFHKQHDCMQGFEKDLSHQRRANGNVQDKFTIEYSKPQDPQFVRLNQNLCGFDLLQGQAYNHENELCQVKLPQIVTKEKNEEGYKEGEASVADFGLLYPAS